MRLVRALAAQEATGLPPHGKGISIEEGNSEGNEPSNLELKVKIGVLKQTIIEKDVLIGKLDVRVIDREADVNSKSTQITDLQTHLGALIVCYYDLKNKLYEEFCDKLKSSVDQPVVS